MKVITYLSFPGNCQAAFRFYEQALGGQIRQMFPYKGSPAESQVPAQMVDKVMHAVLQLGDTVLMASDRIGQTGTDGMNGFSVSLNVDSPEEAERLFSRLADGGEVTMPLQETFWAWRYGALVDRFGMPWMVNCEKPM